ncbi:MAG: Quinone oxidoreductase 1 [Alphaproteobacteria bacterium MarineAlpha9_Bin4]|nr:NADPH:quinone oxidoreductase [Pelagibacterales bacterium]PPR27095.1 MAG: Quinone oxidoreductase 1 [Alphaproteobacteria bacterium MarineAlpha9_Bin4]|tara:strand:+ start:628 stop:1599 length:972 start_codon:yes stop_codon:yes gene_type:complete
MFNVIAKKYGDPDILIYEKSASHKIASDSVRINVKGIGVNFADILIIKGKYQERPRPPFSPGLEVSGIISEIGSNVKKFKIGDSVVAIMKYGGYKTEVVVPQENTYFLPQGMDLLEAGGFPVIYGTAFSAIVTKARLKKNEKCVILGATGGVGMAAIEIAKAYGANVIACGGDDRKLSECLKKGADTVLNYNNNILRQELKKIGVSEVDVVIDMVGGQSSLDLVKSLKWDGRIIIVGFTSGKIPEIPANRLLLKNARAEGLYWGELAYRKPEEIEKDLKVLGQLFKDNKLNPCINKIFDLQDAPQALKELSDRKNIGKIILKC